MKAFMTNSKGNSSLLAVFLAAALCVLAVVVYSGAMIFSNYQTAQTELERAAGVSVDINLTNANVRDLVLDIPEQEALIKLEDNLAEAGYRYCDDTWKRIEEGKILYGFQDMETVIDGDRMTISVTFTMPFPWGSGFPRVEIPLKVISKVLYIG